MGDSNQICLASMEEELALINVIRRDGREKDTSISLVSSSMSNSYISLECCKIGKRQRAMLILRPLPFFIA